MGDFSLQTADERLTVAQWEDGRVAGFVSVFESARFIHHLFVEPGSLGCGVGTRLLESLHGWLPYPWQLKCQSANTPALAFYSRRGWKERGRSSDAQGPYVLLEYHPPDRVNPSQ